MKMLDKFFGVLSIMGIVIFWVGAIMLITLLFSHNPAYLAFCKQYGAKVLGGGLAANIGGGLMTMAISGTSPFR